MSYDYTGIRVKKDSSSGITTFPFSGYEIDPSGIVTKYIKIGNQIVGASKGGEKLFYHNDHLGGVNVITDIWTARVQLVEYDPWGKVSREEGIGDSLRRFTGKMLDPESGLYYYGGRYYDPELGRFISPDPFVPQPSDPQSFNRYSYVENNPVNKIDPSGHKSFWKKIGKAFKNLFSKPGKFFATLAAGIAAGLVLGPVAGGLLGAESAWATAAVSGAVGGAAGGATGAALYGGNIWQGMLLGAFGGGIGGGVAGHIGATTFRGIVSGAVAGGAAAGALGTAFHRGNFFENMALGGVIRGILGVAQGLAMTGWQAARNWTNDSWREGSGPKVVDSTGEPNTVGTRAGENQSLLAKTGITGAQEGSFNVETAVGRFVNLVSKVHDWMNGWTYSKGDNVSGGPIFDTAVDLFWNVPGMVPAAAYTGFAFYGTTHSYFAPVRERQ